MTVNCLFKEKIQAAQTDEIFHQLLHGQSVSMIGMPGVGKSNPLYWIEQLAKKHDHHITVHIDLNNMPTSSDLAFYRLFLLELADTLERTYPHSKISHFAQDESKTAISTKDEFLTFSSIKRITTELVKKHHNQIIIIFDSFELARSLSLELFNTLYALRNVDTERITYLFSTNRDVSKAFSLQTAGNLFHLINGNKKWLLPANKEITSLLIKRLAKYLGGTISPEDIKEIYTLSNGNLGYVKALTKLFVEKEVTRNTPIVKIAQHPVVLVKTQQLWEHLCEDDRSQLTLFINGTIPYDKLSEFLKKSQIVVKETNNIFSPLLEAFISGEGESRQTSNSHTNATESIILNLDLKQRIVLKGTQPVRKLFTRNEFNLLRHFFKNEKSAVSREEIATVLWENKENGKYSDWAIDKLVSRIREKIEEDPKKPRFLITLRGVGFKFFRAPN